MGDFDSFFKPGAQQLNDDYSFVDADTLRDKDNKRYRIQGIDAPEIAKLDRNTLLPGWQGTAGAGISNQELMRLAREKGFTNVVHTKDIDPNGRPIIRLTDNDGRDFAKEILKAGILDTNRYTNEKDVLSAEVGEILRSRTQYEDTDWDKARNAIKETIDNETLYDAGLKEQAIVEADLAELQQKRGESDEDFELRKQQHEGLYSQGSVQFRSKDRTLKNKAVNPLSESFDLGFKGVQEGLWGLINLVGESSGWDAAADIGEAGVARAQAAIADKPELKLSALNDKGEWDIKSWNDAFGFLTNNAAVSLPYMAVTIGGAVASPFTGGLSLLAPVSVYTGQTWNEMEDKGDKGKSASIAIAAGVTQTVLDKLGLKGLVGGSILNKSTRNTAIKAIMDRDGVSKRVASDILAQQTRKEIAALAGDAAKVAGQQLAARNVVRGLATSASRGLVSEGATEAAQELTAYMAAVAGSDKEFDAVQLQDRLINATLAGGTLGAGFAVPGTAYDVGAWTDVAVRQAPAEQVRLSRAGKFAKEEADREGRVKTIQELNEETEAAANARGNVEPWQDRIAEHKKAQKQRTVFDTAKDTWASIPGLWRGATRFIFTESLQNRSRAARVLADMFGGNLQRTFSGSTFENRKHHLLSEYKNLISDPLNILKATGQRRTGDIALKNASDVINRFGEEVKAAEAEGRDINWDSVPQEDRQWLGQYYNEVIQLGDKLWHDQAKHNPNLGYVKNYLFHYKAFNKAAIEKNKSKFIQALIDKKGLSHVDAKDIANSIIERDVINGEQDFHVGYGKQIPGSHRARTLNLSDDPDFSDFMEQNFFNNVSNAAKSAARYVTYQEYIGDDNKKVNELIQQMEDEGISKEEVNKVAAQLQDYLDAESGNYKRIENENWLAIQRNLMLWTTLAGLPLATISSFVELALTTKSLTKDQIFGTIKTIAQDGAKGLYDKMAFWRNPLERAKAKQEKQSTLKNLGYFNWEVGAAHTTGTTEIKHSHQKFLDNYFKIIQLQQWTDFTRHIRGSAAIDFITDKLDIISSQRQNGDIYTNEVQEAEEQLRALGLNVDDMVAIYDTSGPLTPEQEKVKADNMREATFNFINEAVALPQSANRPLFYQNPHLALFTQFQGFISTFTANHIPKMWGELVKRGTPAMKYNAFATMSTMLLLGFASQYLKDLLKYGQGTPYLDDLEKLQRAVGASGLLGTGERVLNFAFPLYEQQTQGPVDWFFNTLSGEAAALSNVSRAVEGTAQFVTGEREKGFYKFLKTAPYMGPLNSGNKFLSDALWGTGDQVRSAGRYFENIIDTVT